MTNARASFPLPAVSSQASSSLPPMPPTTPKTMTPKPAMAPNHPRPPKLVMAPKPAMTPKPVMTPKAAATPKPAMAPKPDIMPKSAMAPKHATTPKTVQKSSLNDSRFAIPASSTPAASTAGNVPGSPTPSRRVVPLEKTAGFSSQAKAARPKPSDEPKSIDERQKEKGSEGPAAVLLDVDQDEEANAETETQIRNLLFSPGMEELTGITFPTENPTEDEPPLLSSDDVQGSNYPDPQLPRMVIELTKTAYIAKQILELIGNCSGYIQDRLQAAHPHDPVLGPLKATSLVVIEAISKKVVEEWTQKHLRAYRSPEEEAAPGPSTPTPSQDQRFALPKTESMAPELKTDQPDKTSIFDNYRTPPRSASATVTDSSDEKKQRNIDAASLLSPKKRVVSSDIPAMKFESLRVSEGGNIRTVSAEPLSLLDMDLDPTPSKQVTARTATRSPVLGSMESSMFAAPANAPYQHNKAKVIGVRPSPSYPIHEQQSDFD